MSDAILCLTSGPSVKEGRVSNELTLKWLDGDVEKYVSEQRWGTATPEGVEMLSGLVDGMLKQLSKHGVEPSPGVYLVFKDITNEQFVAMEEAGIALQQKLIEYGKQLAEKKKKGEEG